MKVKKRRRRRSSSPLRGCSLFDDSAGEQRESSAPELLAARRGKRAGSWPFQIEGGKEGKMPMREKRERASEPPPPSKK